MNVLLTGAGGFIGRAIHAALRQAGHSVVAGRSPHSPDTTGLPMDFTRDTQVQDWLPRLAGVDAVVNAVGVLRDSAARPMDAVHVHTPIALFDACAQAGVRRVVHISALGIEHNATRYATTKRAADTHLLEHTAQGRLDGVVLRPSIVFGRGGDSSAMFMQLARLPLVVLPGPVLTAQVQPLSVRDLAAAVAALLGPQAGTCGLLPLTGPRALPLADFIASLRTQRGLPPARTARLPDWPTRWSARCGDVVPVSPWCSETLALLASDNTADAAPLRRLLGHPATPPDTLVATAWEAA